MTGTDENVILFQLTNTVSGMTGVSDFINDAPRNVFFERLWDGSISLDF